MRHDQKGDEGPVDQEAQERQLEDEEADVLAELGVLYAEADPVREQQPVLHSPMVRGGCTQGEHEGDGGIDTPGIGPDRRW